MILITGASGLVGTNLLYEITKRQWKVKALIRSDESKKHIYRVLSLLDENPDVLFNQIDWAYGDVTDNYSLDEAFEGIKKVFHCAAIVSFDRADKNRMLEVNRTGTSNIVNQSLAHNIEKLIYVSSVAAIKSSVSNEPAKEENGWPLGKNNLYAYSKTLAEMEVWRGICEGLNAVIVNPSVILGFGDWKRGSSEIFRRVYNGMKYYTHGVTGFVDVLDLVKCMIYLMESNLHSERFIVSGANVAYKELFIKIATCLKVNPPRLYATPLMTELAWRLEAIKSKITFSEPRITRQIARTAHHQQYYSSEKLKSALNFEFTPIDSSLKRIAELYLRDAE